MKIQVEMAKRVGEKFLANPSLETRRIRAAKDAVLILREVGGELSELATQVLVSLEKLQKEFLQ
jgi:hypothetical protein